MLRCLSCGLLYASEIYDKKTIVNLYKESKFNYSNELKGLKKTYTYCIKNVLDENINKENF